MRRWISVFADLRVQGITHPDYDASLANWTKYRKTFRAGKEFVNDYLERFSNREDWGDFRDRKRISYCPAHAKAAVIDIKNAIYQRMVDIRRDGGPDTYTYAAGGEKGGVDFDGNSMTGFIGRKILPELLSMGKVGVYVDKKPIAEGADKNVTREIRPYIYMYRTESIRSWSKTQEGVLTSVLLQDTNEVTDTETGLVIGLSRQYRLLKMVDGKVVVSLYNLKGEKLSDTQLDLSQIPFVIFELSDSLLVDVADYQIAMTNLASSDMNYSMKSNFPFYTEQFNPIADLPMLRQATQGNGSTTTQDGEAGEAATAKSPVVEHGTAQGRKYPKGLERPGFINPSAEPLHASMDKQAQLKEEIRELINLSVSNLQPVRASAESKQEDSKGLEAGLSYIGMELQYGESKIAEVWSEYEATESIAKVTYPQNYSLKTDNDRLNEAKKYREELPTIPSIDFQRVVAKEIVNMLIGHKVTVDQLKAIYAQIDESAVVVTDPDIIAQDLERGLVSTETASAVRLYPKGEVEKAKADHMERLIRIREAQSDPASRGNLDESADDAAARLEKEKSRITDEDEVVVDKTRGVAKS